MASGTHLFVFGTLMSAATGPLGRLRRERLMSEAQLLGPATIQGRLYDLGRYPGLVDTKSPYDSVHGDVLELADTSATFAWLDPYEGIFPGKPEENHYARVERPVRLDDGRELVAWVYVYVRDVSKGRSVPSGRWEV